MDVVNRCHEHVPPYDRATIAQPLPKSIDTISPNHHLITTASNPYHHYSVLLSGSLLGHYLYLTSPLPWSCTQPSATPPYTISCLRITPWPHLWSHHRDFPATSTCLCCRTFEPIVSSSSCSIYTTALALHISCCHHAIAASSLAMLHPCEAWR